MFALTASGLSTEGWGGDSSSCQSIKRPRKTPSRFSGSERTSKGHLTTPPPFIHAPRTGEPRLTLRDAGTRLHCVLCLVCLPLRVRPRVCPVPVLRF